MPPIETTTDFYRQGVAGIEYLGMVRKMAAINFYVRGLNPGNIQQGDALEKFGTEILPESKTGVLANPQLVLSHLDAGTLTPEIAALAHPERHGFAGPQWGRRAATPGAWQPCRIKAKAPLPPTSSSITTCASRSPASSTPRSLRAARAMSISAICPLQSLAPRP